MKTKLLTIVCVLLLSTYSNLMAVEYISLNAVSGTINISGVYTNNVYKVWDINTGQNEVIHINYDIDIENDCDYIWIYSINDYGEEDYEIELTGTKQGSTTTIFPNGKARIVFYTDNSINYSSGGFSPSVISYEVDANSQSASNLYLSENAFVKGKIGIGTAPYAGKLGVSNNVSQTGTPYGISSSSYNNTNYGSSYGTYSSSSATGLNSRAYGLYANAYSSNSTSTVYGIYSSVSGVSGTKKWAGYFSGGNLEVVNGSVFSEDLRLGKGNKQFIFHTAAFLPNEPPIIYIAPKVANTDNTWDWSKQIILKNDGSILMSAGRLGVGTTTPEAKLQVNVEGNPANLEYDATNGFMIKGTDHVLYMGVNSDSHVSYIQSVDYATTTSPLLLNARGGYIGVNTMTPQYDLDVAGTIRAREVKIDLNGGADFVFEPSYRLRPLDELRTFVSENKRLPEIPSAAEMTDKGVDMGEFQVKLLQKIEELTLYTLQQQEEIRALRSELEKLK